MTPTTEAGRALLEYITSDLPQADQPEPEWPAQWAETIAAIEAEAAAAERERIAANYVTPSEEAQRRLDAVHAEHARLAGLVRDATVYGGDEDYWEGVNEMRAAVLALLEPALCQHMIPAAECRVVGCQP